MNFKNFAIFISLLCFASCDRIPRYFTNESDVGSGCVSTRACQDYEETFCTPAAPCHLNKGFDMVAQKKNENDLFIQSGEYEFTFAYGTYEYPVVTVSGWTELVDGVQGQVIPDDISTYPILHYYFNDNNTYKSKNMTFVFNKGAQEFLYVYFFLTDRAHLSQYLFYGIYL
jgi:hypothetical protein